MSRSPEACFGRSRLSAYVGAATVCAVVTWLAVFGAAPGADSQGAKPSGRWSTFASGDDVLSVAVDGGVLWSGTRGGGLVRWDMASGEYEQFLAPQDPLGGNLVFDLALDGAGHLWLATSGGLSVFDDGGTTDRDDDAWFTYTTENGLGMPSDEVRAVAAQGTVVWVGGVQSRDVATGEWSGGGVGRVDSRGSLDPEDDVWAPIATFADTYREEVDGTSEPGLVSDTVNDLLVSPGGNLWVAASPHWRYDVSGDPEAGLTWQREHGGLSFRDTRGTADPGDDRWTGYSCELADLAVTCSVKRLALDARGRGWAADGGRGVIHFDPERGQLGGPQARFVPPPEEGDSFVLDIAFGPESDAALTNTVWLATRGGGVTVLDHRGTLANRTDDLWNLDRGGPFGRGNGLARQRVQAITATSERMWLGLGTERGEGGGLQALELDDLTFDLQWRTEQAPPSNFITDVAFGERGSRWQGHVWVSTGARGGAGGARQFGLGVVDLDTRDTIDASDDAWTRYTSEGTDDNGALPWSGLVGDNVQAVFVQGDMVWFGSAETRWDAEEGRYADGGLAVFDGTRWTARRPAAAGASGIGAGGVSALAGGCDGELWIGTGNQWDNVGSGLMVRAAGTDVHTPAADRLTRHVYPQVASANTNAIAADCARRRVWVGHMHHVNTAETGGPIGQWAGGGLSRWDLGAASWTRFGSQDGLETFAAAGIRGEVASVAVDAAGAVWAGAFGTESMDAGALVATRPYWPAVLNRFDGSAWENWTFDRSGVVSSVAVDRGGRVWAATSRHGMTRDSVSPDNWPTGDAVGGLMVGTGTQWARFTSRDDGLPSNDVSVVREAPDGTIWIGTLGWGMARFEPGAPPRTATPTHNLPTRTPSPTRDPNEPTSTRPPTRLPTLPTQVPSPTRPATATLPRPGVDQSYFPWAHTHGHGPPRPPLEEHVYLPWTVKAR